MFYTLVEDSEAGEVSTAETYVMQFINQKWSAGEWTLAGHPLVDAAADSLEVLAEPGFQVCQIRGGQLKVASSSIAAFAGTSTLLRARLLHEAQKSDSDFAVPDLTIGAGGEPPRTRARLTGDAAAEPAAGTITAAAVELEGQPTDTDIF